MSPTVDSLRMLADELQATTTSPKTADAPDLTHYRIHAIRTRVIEQEVIKERRQEEHDRRARWLNDFAHGIYVLELQWACLLARSATRNVGVSEKHVRRHVKGAA